MLDPVVNANLKPYSWLWTTGQFGGSARIVRDYLDLDDDDVLPIVFPHGIDADTNAVAEDATRYEPLYLAVRKAIGDLAAPIKPVLYFPHPWLMLPPPEDAPAAQGTLFVAPPSSPRNNLNLYEAICKSDLPKPWGIMLKFRGLDERDFAWWRERGFATHTAGPSSSPDFYLNQRQALLQYETVALSYLSSIAVLASNLRRKLVGIPDVDMHIVSPIDYDRVYINHDRREIVTGTWGILLGEDREAAYRLSLNLMGAEFMAPKEELRRRIIEAIAKIDEPVYFDGIDNRHLRRMLTWLVAKGVHVNKLLPNPASAALRKIAFLLGLNRVGIMSGSEFSHFGMLGHDKRFEFHRTRAFRVGRGSHLGEGPKRDYKPRS